MDDARGYLYSRKPLCLYVSKNPETIQIISKIPSKLPIKALTLAALAPYQIGGEISLHRPSLWYLTWPLNAIDVLVN